MTSSKILPGLALAASAVMATAAIPTAATAQATCETYTVQPGDTLAAISTRVLGAAGRFPEIAALNGDALIKNPGRIFPGMELKMPCASEQVSDTVIAQQRARLAASSAQAGFGPQSPRDLTTPVGANTLAFGEAPPAGKLNLCNIHFHKNAEHRGGQFTSFAGNGNGKGYGTGYKYDGTLSAAELAPLDAPVGSHKYGALEPGDTIEIHFVHSSAKVEPGPTLGACLSPSIGNPQLRVETVVAVLVNDPSAGDMVQLAEIAQQGELFQAPNIPSTLGTPITYAGSTTGPSYNEVASPVQVSWSVRPDVLKLDISSVGDWLKDNVFDEKYAHGVRNLVVNPDLISSLD